MNLVTQMAAKQRSGTQAGRAAQVQEQPARPAARMTQRRKQHLHLHLDRSRPAMQRLQRRANEAHLRPLGHNMIDKL